jgi:heme oxygenase (biliverdin-IX-beta and delta-forming)
MRPFILEQLKQCTQISHDQISSHIDVLRDDLSLSDYCLLLQRLWGFYTPLEIQIKQVLTGSPIDLDFAKREKAPLLEQDLRTLQFSPFSDLPLCAELPPLTNPGQVLGCLYVLEGATLGGQIIYRHLQKVLHLNQESGCSYFYSYGTKVGRMWESYCSILTAYMQFGQEEEQILSAACATFYAFDKWIQEGKI